MHAHACHRCQCLLAVDDANAALHAAVAEIGEAGRTYWFISSGARSHVASYVYT